MELFSTLSLEQQFKLNLYRHQVKQLSQEEAQEYLLEVLRQLMVKDNLIKNLVKESF
jgi:uncharacterized protein YaaW (UPF0174 family)